ncbi:unnamed protein product, partial [marine sediment metagenome]
SVNWNILSERKEAKVNKDIVTETTLDEIVENVICRRNSTSIPTLFGNVSHRSALEYDVVFVSNALIDEKVNLPILFLTSDIPMFVTQRRSIDGMPLFFLGGSAADFSEVFCGDSSDGKERGFIDGVFVGSGEGVVEEVVGILMKYNKTPKGKNAAIKELYNIECFYNPLAYIHDFEEDGWTIREIRKIDDDAPDVVKISRPHNLDNHPGFERKILHSSGANVESSDIQISMGCSGGGVCTFCHEAHVAGGWRERSIKRIIKDMETARSY